MNKWVLHLRSKFFFSFLCILVILLLSSFIANLAYADDSSSLSTNSSADINSNSDYSWVVLRMNGGFVSNFRNTWSQTETGDYVKEFKNGTSYSTILNEWVGKLDPYESYPYFYKQNYDYVSIEPQNGTLQGNTEFNVNWKQYYESTKVSATAGFKFDDDGCQDEPCFDNYEWTGETGYMCNLCNTVFTDNYPGGATEPFSCHCRGLGTNKYGYCPSGGTHSAYGYDRYTVANLFIKQRPDSVAYYSNYNKDFYINLDGGSAQKCPHNWNLNNDGRYFKRFMSSVSNEQVLTELFDMSVSKSGFGFNGWQITQLSSTEYSITPIWNSTDYVSVHICMNGGTAKTEPEGWYVDGDGYSKSVLKGSLITEILEEWNGFSQLTRHSNEYFNKWSDTEEFYLNDDTTFTAEWSKFNFSTLDDGEYYLSHYGYFDVDGSSLASGASIITNTQNFSDSQKWDFVELDNGNVEIINKNSGLCLTADSSNPTAGTKIVQKSYKGLYNQQWVIESGCNFKHGILSAANKSLILEKSDSSSNVILKDSNVSKSQNYMYSVSCENTDDSLCPEPEVQTKDKTSVTLSWDAVDGASKYSVWQKETGMTSYKIISGWQEGTSYKISGLSTDTQYTFCVRALVKGKMTPICPKSIIYVDLQEKPEASVVDVTHNSISLSWDLVEGASKYAVATQNDDGASYTTYINNLSTTNYTINGLEDGKTYKCLVQAYVNGVWTRFNDRDLVSATTTSIKPVVSAAASGDGQVTLSWPAIENATNYVAYEVVGSEFRQIGSYLPSIKTSLVVDDLANGYKHTFLVQAEVGGQWSKYSDKNYASATPTGTVKPALDEPVVAGTSITLTWTHVPGVSAYAIATKVGSSKYTTYTMSCTEETYTIKNLEEGVTYDCLVQANINGNWSSFDSGDLKQATTKGTRPVVDAVGTGDGEVTLSWDAIDGADKYAAYEIVNGNFVAIDENIPASTRSVSKQDLANGYQHTFLVQAHVGGTWSKYSERNYAYATPTGTAKPTISSATVAGTSITLTWNHVPGVSAYAIATKVGSSKYTTYTMSCTEETYTIKGLEEGVTYDCLVQANINGNWSSFDSGDLKQATTKGTRPVVDAEGTGDGIVTLEWGAIDGADKYAAYEVVNGSFVVINENIPAGTCTVTKEDLANDYQHTFLVQAHVGGTWSKYSERNFAYATPTGTVKPTLNQPTVAGTSITLTWNHVPGVSTYAVATKVGSSKYTTYTMSCTEETYTIKNLEEGVTYDCLVQANINGNWSSFDSGDLKQATTKGTRPAPSPEAGDGSVKLTWDAIDNATKYVAYEVIDGKYVQIGAEITAPTTTVTKTDLVNEQQHTFLVQAYVGGTWSKYSENNYVYATPHGAVKPTISSSTSTDTTITVNWASVSGSDGYCAAISTDGTHWTNNMLDKSATTYTFTGLQSSTAYKVLVQRRVGNIWSTFTAFDLLTIKTLAST